MAPRHGALGTAHNIHLQALYSPMPGKEERPSLEFVLHIVAMVLKFEDDHRAKKPKNGHFWTANRP